jgi:preprotein translocase subunit SecB
MPGLSQLQLEDAWVTRLEFSSSEAADSLTHAQAGSYPRVSWELLRKPDKGTYLVQLKILDRQSTTRLSMVIEGTFSFPEEMAENMRFRMSNVNGPTILYGIARGIVGGLTGFAAGGRYLLPSVNMVELAQRQDKRRLRRQTQTAT